MPQACSDPASPSVKTEPYPPQSPSKGRAGPAKGVSFTEDMDKNIINHVLSISDINLRYNWSDLANGALKQFTAKQASRAFHRLFIRSIPSAHIEIGGAAQGSLGLQTESIPVPS